MKAKKYIMMLIALMIISGCEAERTISEPAESAKTEQNTIPLLTSDDNTLGASAKADAPITFDSRNSIANDGLSEETTHRMQYQNGHINYIPVSFNNSILTADTYSEFASLIRGSNSIAADNEWLKDGETTVNCFIMENGDCFTFYDHRPIEIMVDSSAVFPIDYKFMGLSFGDTVEDINKQLGTEFVEYPELTTLVIRDTDSNGYVQFTFDENNRISRMEYRFDEFGV